MKTEVECCALDEPVEVAAERMRSRNIGFLPVCDEDGVVVGTLTDRDLALRVLGEHRIPEDTLVQDVMSAEPVDCSPDDDLSIAEELMAMHKKSRIICSDVGRHPVGVISLSDIARVEDRVRVAEIIDAVSSREAPQPSL